MRRQWASISDDGHGGADPAGGSGLLGLTDRAEALGGRFGIESAPGCGTTLVLELPLAAPASEAAQARASASDASPSLTVEGGTGGW